MLRNETPDVKRQVLGKGSTNEIVTFSVGSCSAVSILCEVNFILAKNLSVDGPNPASSLFSL